MIGLSIVVGIIALFALILSVRAHIHIEYEENLLAYAKWSFLKIPLFPRPEKPPKAKKKAPPKEEQKPEPEKEETPKEEKPKGPNPLSVLYENEKLSGILEILQKLLQVIDKFGRGFINSFVIDEMFLDITVSKPDAAETAEEYGRVCRKVFPVTGAVVANCNVRKYSINIDADYLADGRGGLAFSLEISLNPRLLINAVLSFAFGALFKVGLRLLKGIKPKKASGGKQNNPDNSGQSDNEASQELITSMVAAGMSDGNNTVNNTESGA